MAEPTNAEVSDERLRELLPCPFCGGAAEWCKGERGDGTPWPYLACEDCEAMGPAVAHPATESEWITAWNRRSVTSQASEGEVVAWEWWSAGRPDIKRVQHSKPGLVPNRQMRPLYTSPVSKRVERLETALRDVINEVLNVGSASYIRKPVLTMAIKALQGGRS